MAVIADPEGAVFGIWQPGSFSGAELVNEPGSLSWNELNTRDPEAAESFYGDLFGWSFAEMDMGESGSYTTMHLPGAAEDDQGIAGLLDMRGRVPDEVPPHWTTYFTIADLDASLEAAKGAGGNVMFGPLELPMGRLALISDPQGVTFGLWQTLMSSE